MRLASSAHVIFCSRSHDSMEGNLKVMTASLRHEFSNFNGEKLLWDVEAPFHYAIEYETILSHIQSLGLESVTWDSSRLKVGNFATWDLTWDLSFWTSSRDSWLGDWDLDLTRSWSNMRVMHYCNQLFITLFKSSFPCRYRHRQKRLRLRRLREPDMLTPSSASNTSTSTGLMKRPMLTTWKTPAPYVWSMITGCVTISGTDIQYIYNLTLICMRLSLLGSLYSRQLEITRLEGNLGADDWHASLRHERVPSFKWEKKLENPPLRSGDIIACPLKLGTSDHRWKRLSPPWVMQKS